MMPQLAHGVENRVVEAGRLLGRAKAGFIRLAVHKAQRIGRAEALVHNLVAGLEQKIQPLARPHFEMVLALGADVQIRLDIGLEQRLPAARAFAPESLCANASFAIAA